MPTRLAYGRMLQQAVQKVLKQQTAQQVLYHELSASSGSYTRGTICFCQCDEFRRSGHGTHGISIMPQGYALHIISNQPHHAGDVGGEVGSR